MKKQFLCFKIFLLLVLMSMLLACSSSKIPFVTTTVQSGSYLNPDINNQSAPVVVTLYQLKSSTAFQQANFFSLYNSANTVLGADLLDKQEVEIRPGQKQELKLSMSPDASCIGVIAAFRDPDNAQWRQLVPVTQGKNLDLIINLSAASLSAKLK